METVNAFIENIKHIIYTELYAKCTTPVDYEELLKTSPENADGRKIIPCRNYEIDGNLFDEIIINVLNKYNLTPTERFIIKWGVYMGHSPNTIKED